MLTRTHTRTMCFLSFFLSHVLSNIWHERAHTFQCIPVSCSVRRFFVFFSQMESSITLSLTGRTSNLSAYYMPPIELEPNFNYGCALVDMQTSANIPNVYEKNCNFCYLEKKEVKMETKEVKKYDTDGGGAFMEYVSKISGIELAQIFDVKIRTKEATVTILDVNSLKILTMDTGVYEFEDLRNYLERELEKVDVFFRLRINKQTLKVHFECSATVIFSKQLSTLHTILGYRDGVYHNTIAGYHATDIIRISHVFFFFL